MKLKFTPLLVLLFITICSLNAQEINTSITVQQSDSLIRARSLDTNFVILDIRTDMEYTAGHLGNAIQIDFLKKRGKREMWKLDRTKAYLIYCRSGRRSKSALDMMKERKFPEVYNMLGGIKDWTKEGYVVIKEQFEDVEFEKGKKIKK